MATYDIVMLVLLVFCIVFGAFKGMAWQIASLASLTLSAGLAVHFSQPLAPYLSEQAPWNRFLAMLVIFLAASLVVWLLFRVVSGLLDRMKLKDWDRQLGGVFGVVQGLLLCLVITFFALGLSEAMRQTILHSRSGYYTAVIVQKGYPFVPQELREVIGQYVDEFNRRLDPAAGGSAGSGLQNLLGTRDAAS